MVIERTAWISGANRGIGLAIARGLSRHGCHLVLACRDVQSGESEAEPLRAAGVKVHVLHLDLTDPRSIQAAVAETRQRGLSADVLVNNAGTYPHGDVLRVSDHDMRAAMELHFFGPLALCQAFVPEMVRRGYGRVVNVSSGYGAFSDGLEGSAAYALSKAALNALTLKLANEVDDAVKVNAMCPGWVRTRMGGNAAPRSPEEGADTAIWLATLPVDGPSGGFFRDRTRIDW